MSDHDGITNFYSDHDKGNLEWGGTVFGNKLSIYIENSNSYFGLNCLLH